MMSKTKGSQAPKSKKSFVSNCLLLLNCLLIMTPVDAYCSTLVDKIAQVSASSLVLNYQTTLSNAPSQSATVQTPQPTNAYECTQVAIEDIDPTLLTKEERIALLDGSLKDSIDQYSTCVSTVQQNMSASAGGSGGGSGNSDAEGQEAGSGEAETETTNNTTSPANSDITEPMPAAKSITPAQRGVIPPKDNDKIICKLLFNEIKSINDPDMLKGLKEQYESYKCG